MSSRGIRTSRHLDASIRRRFRDPGRRVARQRCNDAALSPEGRPRKSPSIEMSSSSAGQWMPTPAPTKCHFRRSAGRPSANRGYHFNGTETRRPSRSSTTSASVVNLTPFAVASVARAEEFMTGRRIASRRRRTTALGKWRQAQAESERLEQSAQRGLCWIVAGINRAQHVRAGHGH